MKILFIALLVGSILVGIWLLSHRLTEITTGGVTAAFATDLSDYVVANNMCLPTSWSEFTNWTTNRYTTPRWKSDQLAKMFAIEWGKHLSSTNDCNHLVTVTDAETRTVENDLNVLLFTRLGAYCQSNDTRRVTPAQNRTVTNNE
jgi:hypothetical protein